MPYKKIDSNKWVVTFSKRNPASKKAITLRRIVKTEAAAKRELQKMIGDVERRIIQKTVPSWKEVFASYLQDCRNRGLNDSTIYNIDKCVTAATMYKWQKRPVTEITTQEIRDLVLIDFRERSQSHQKSMLKFIRLTMQYAVDCGDLLQNPTPKLAFRIGDKIKTVLTEPQIRIFLDTAKQIDWDWYYHCTTAVYTGMRNGELYALTWDKVNLVERQILVDSSWNSKDGFKDTKSGDDRIVEIAPPLLVLLKELKLQNPDSHFVLPRMREWDVGEQARHLRMFLRGIGLPEVRFHDLRASWATVMLSKGIPPAKVMMMGGWKDIKTMMIYMRKAGVEIKGITDCLQLHDPLRESAKVLDFSKTSL